MPDVGRKQQLSPRYKCRACGSIYPLIVPAVNLEVVVGDIHVRKFVPHGPRKDCIGQVFDLVEPDHSMEWNE